MSAAIPSPAARRQRNTLHRWIRQLHLWIGAWGALAAVLYGSTGLIMSHRFGDGAWPQGDSEELGKRTLTVPADARSSAEALSLWLEKSEGLSAQMIRKPSRDEPAKGPPRWSLNGGTASDSWSLDYKVGGDTAELKRSHHSTLAALSRMHKAVSGGQGWRLLGDSFAIGMILLGVSGLLLWARGRTPKQMLVSVAGVSTIVMIVVLGLNLL